jgi:hypothetical protein
MRGGPIGTERGAEGRQMLGDKEGGRGSSSIGYRVLGLGFRV